ncbi:MAG: FemAB family PEP-CTERM system-associated protein [Planctomycetota bacterium]|nr:FemAB family PEP-CTERM system-associated protein [Planctomycetota bacterium]MDG2143728.1 FemAB family PEP-CTERM system-associated protein [Planctomycetota bacterium]
MSSYEIRPGTPEVDLQRDAFVHGHKSGSFFHLSHWSRVVQRVFGHRRRDLIAFGGDKGEDIVGVLPLMQSPRVFGGSNLISVPFAVYGGPIGETPEIELALVEAAEKLGKDLGVGRVEMRTREPLSFEATEDRPGLEGELPKLSEGSLYVTFECDLPEKPEDVLAGMPKKARAEARKARTKHGLELAQGRWYVDDLFRLFLRNKHQLGSPCMPPRLFTELLNEFGTDAEVHLVRQGKVALAAVMTFRYGDTLLAYYAGTAEGADREFSASNFMYMALQEWAVERGYKKFDFGRSRRDSGAMSFKKRQGFEPQELHYRYLLLKDRALPSFTPSNPKTAILRDTWTKLPVPLVQWLSSHIARYLP